MWYRKLKHIPWQNRGVECIVDGKDNIIIECELFNSRIIDYIILKHNDAVHEAYREGMYDGVKIAEEIKNKK